MVKWTLVYTKQAQKDARWLSAFGLREMPNGCSTSLRRILFECRRHTNLWLVI